MIEISHVSKFYDDVQIIHDVTLNIPKGGVISIIGPNGAGKSTLLSMISRLLKIDTGHITVDEMNVSTVKGEEFAKRLSILRQDNTMTARLTVYDLVSFGRYPYSKGRLTIQDKDYIDEAIGYLKLEELKDRFLDELSGGQRQRAFVAMVLAQDTDYVLLDEPLNNLDMRHSVNMMRMLKTSAIELSKTVIMVIHDVNFASCYSDQIIALKDGKVAYSGTPEEIMTPEVLSDLYDLTIDVNEVCGRRIAIYY